MPPIARRRTRGPASPDRCYSLRPGADVGSRRRAGRLSRQRPGTVKVPLLDPLRAASPAADPPAASPTPAHAGGCRIAPVSGSSRR